MKLRDNNIILKCFTATVYVYKKIMAVKASSKTTLSGERSTGDPQKDTSLSRLLEMGFSYSSSLATLEATGYDLAGASVILARQTVDLSRTPTKGTVESMEDSSADSGPPTKRKHTE